MEVKKEMKDMKLHGEDLQQFGLFEDPQTVGMKDEEEIWFETVSHHHHQENDDDDDDNNKMNINHDNDINTNDMIDVVDVVVSDPSGLFYGDFPPLPDFPCMSSSSSSSSTPATAMKPLGVSSTATSSSASSGAASWAGLKSDADHDPEHGPSSSAEVANPPPSDHQHQGLVGVDEMGMDEVDHCMDMMQNFGCIDLLESADMCWDPSPLFEHNNGDNNNNNNNNNNNEFIRLDEENDEESVFEQFMHQHKTSEGEILLSNNNNNNNANINTNVDSVTTSGVVNVGGGGGAHQMEVGSAEEEDDLAVVFFEWLKSNKEAISAEDLRNIKIKKSTIDNAARRLGGGKEGMKQLLKLILQWQCFSPATWLPTPTPPPPPPPPQFVGDSSLMGPPHPPPGFGYMGGGDPYSGSNPMAAYPPPPIPPSDYHSWGPTPMHFGVGPQYGSYTDQFGGGGYGNPPPHPTVYPGPGYYYHPGPAEGLVRLGSSATKEARKKRMARQRRLFTHHNRSSSLNHHHHQNNNNNNNNQNGSGVINQQMINHMSEQHAVVGNNSNNNNNNTCGVVAPHGNWVYWPPPPPPPPAQVNHYSSPMVGQMMPPQHPPMERSANGFPKQNGVEKKQGVKTEKNLRFLLQKVLKQSDVGNLGRIVLPKKEAETHLPELEARDGIPIAMEDIGTSRVWNMRY
ncbi:B3 domain-containing transcription factor ABI3, partial [Bienertia sinuspersici]